MIYQIQFSGKVVVNSLTSTTHKSMTSFESRGSFYGPRGLLFMEAGVIKWTNALIYDPHVLMFVY